MDLGASSAVKRVKPLSITCASYITVPTSTFWRMHLGRQHEVAQAIQVPAIQVGHPGEVPSRGQAHCSLVVTILQENQYM